MSKNRKPSIIFHTMTTVGAICSLLAAMILIVKSPQGTGFVIFLQLLTSLLLIIISINSWYKYSKLYVEYEVEKRLRQQESTE